jgi:hypothetical protein
MIEKTEFIRKLIRKLGRWMGGAASKSQVERKGNGRCDHGVFAI